MSSRNCNVCNEPIPTKRLAAVPGATSCVPCLEAAGDVPRIKRFDEATKDEIVETYFIHNQYVEFAQLRQNIVAPSNAAFEAAVGDDQFLVPEPLWNVQQDSDFYNNIDERLDEEKERQRAKAYYNYHDRRGDRRGVPDFDQRRGNGKYNQQRPVMAEGQRERNAAA